MLEVSHCLSKHCQCRYEMLIFDIIKLCQCFERHLNVLDLPIDERVPKSSNVGSTGSAISGRDPVRGWDEKENCID